MGGGTRAFLGLTTAAAALVAAVGVASATSPAFCLAAQPAMQKNVGTGKPLKVFPFQNGVWCAFGSEGPYLQRFPSSKAAFMSKAGSGKPVPGLGAPAYFAPAGQGYSTVSVLKGNTELVVGAKSTEQKIVAAAKAILPLVH